MRKAKFDLAPFRQNDKEVREFHHKIAKNVARIRKERGISQLELSLLIGYQSVSLVAGAESGYKNIHFNLEHLYKISVVLGVDICEFFKEDSAT